MIKLGLVMSNMNSPIRPVGVQKWPGGSYQNIAVYTPFVPTTVLISYSVNVKSQLASPETCDDHQLVPIIPLVG